VRLLRVLASLAVFAVATSSLAAADDPPPCKACVMAALAQDYYLGMQVATSTGAAQRMCLLQLSRFLSAQSAQLADTNVSPETLADPSSNRACSTGRSLQQSMNVSALAPTEIPYAQLPLTSTLAQIVRGSNGVLSQNLLGALRGAGLVGDLLNGLSSGRDLAMMAGQMVLQQTSSQLLGQVGGYGSMIGSVAGLFGHKKAAPATPKPDTPDTITDPKLQYAKAEDLIDGKPIARFPLAKDWLKASALQGYAPAEDAYGFGLVNTGDSENGLAWLNKAAMQGYKPAYFDLGYVYSLTDEAQAYKWFSISPQPDMAAALAADLPPAKLQVLKHDAVVWDRTHIYQSS
jgi:hypothetical protein